MMPQWEKFRAKLDNKQSENNIGFQDMQNYLTHLGFEERSRGDHFIYRLPGVAGLLNLQPQGNKCKAYQVAQVVAFLERNGL
jgi:hypothetical protein